VSGLLWRASVRHLVRHPWQIGLSVLGIALGVAVVLAIDLANESARRGFALFAETLAGRATHQIVGGPSGLPEEVYRQLRVDDGVRDAAPVVERDVIAEDRNAPGTLGGTLHVLGIDPLADSPFRSFASAPIVESGTGLSALLTRPGTALVARETLQRLGVPPGGVVSLRVGAHRRTVTLIGVLVPRDELSARALASLVVTDIATAQELLGAEGRLSRIDLIVPDGPVGAALLDRIRARLPGDARVVEAGARAESIDRLTRAFRLNLTALSLLALVVGMFLVYNAMTFSVVARRELLGMLRSLGVTRAEIATLVLAEAAALALVATALGIPLGVLLGQGLVRLVMRTVNDLYVTVSVSTLALPAVSLVKALVLGIAGTVLAAVPPAMEAAGSAPRVAVMRSAIETRARRATPRAALAGLVIVTAGCLALVAPVPGLGVAYAGLFAILLGAALLVPVLTLAAVAALRPLLALAGPAGRLAAAGVVQGLSRTGVALAALMIAVSATVGVGVMIASFRSTVVQWLERSLASDVYVSTPAPVSGRADATLDAELIARIAAAPGVAHVNALRVVRVGSSRGSVQLLALAGDERAWRGFSLVSGDLASARDRVQRGEAVMVTEPFAYRQGVRAGSRIALATARGEHEFTVAAVYHDYGSSEGSVLMSRATYDRFWDDRAVSSLGVVAGEGVDPGALIVTLRRAAGPDAELLIRSNRALREASLAVFDRTFAVTIVLRYLAIAVAFVGVLGALTALGLERSRELAVLRAQGLTRGEVWGLLATQSGLMGLIAGLLALPVGLALAYVLVRVVNQRSFGWTLPLEVSPAVLLQAVLLAVAAAGLAALYPAWRIARMPLPAALRDE
jgi:putative ABC transport system permease protein